MDPRTITVDPTATKLRRVGRLARRRMRIDAAALRDGVHTDGTLTVELGVLGARATGDAEAIQWSADRPVALVIVRSGTDGEDVAFDLGPARAGVARAAGSPEDGGIRYIAFCYDAPPSPVVASALPTPRPLLPPVFAAPKGHVAAAVALTPAPAVAPSSARSAVAPPSVGAVLATTIRERRSILARLLASPKLARDRRVAPAPGTAG